MKPLILLEFVLYFIIQLYVLMIKHPSNAVPLDVWIVMALCASTAFSIAIIKIVEVFRMVIYPAKEDRGFAMVFAFTSIMASAGAYASTLGLALYYEPQAVLWYLGLLVTMLMYFLIPGIAIIQIVIRNTLARREARLREIREQSLFSPRG